MAIVWGAYDRVGAVGTNGMRVGVEITWSSVPSSSTTTTTATLDIWTENIFAYSDNGQTIAYSYSPSSPAIVGPGGTSYNNQQAAGVQTKRITKTWTYTYSTYGSSPGAFTFTATVGNTFNGVTPTVTINGTNGGTIPARPGGPPSIQSVLAVAGIRSSSINWTPNAADPAITSYTVVRNDGTSIGVSGLEASDTSLGNLATASYTVTAFNPAGQGSLTSNSITTPSLPSQPSSLAANATTFGQISLSWTASTASGDFAGGYPISYIISRAGMTSVTTSSLSYTDTTVAPSTAYTYTVTPSSGVGTGTPASVSATSLGGVVNVWNGAWVKVVPQVRNSANTAWVTGQARARNNTTSEWKYGS